MQLLYVMDPMCSWCYGFQPELDAFLERYPEAEVSWIMGGLAPDTDQPMDENLKRNISSYWHQIEEQAEVTFNHDFWALNTPIRSTYPACRAVIAAETLRPKSAQQMVKAIQSAYYLQAKNPSLEDTLIDCASSVGLDKASFSEALKSEETEQHFQQHLGLSHQLQIKGFPALLYIDKKNQAYPLTLGFCQAADLERQLSHIRQADGQD